MKRDLSSRPILTGVFFLLFAALFIMADQASPLAPVQVEEWTADYLAVAREGSMQRQIAYVLIFFLTVVLMFAVRAKRDAKLHRWGTAVCGLFLIWTSASVMWSEDPIAVLRRLIVLGIALFWVYVCARRWAGTTIILFVVFSTMLTVLVSIAAEVLAGRFTPWDHSYRLSGTLAPNELGLSAMVLAIASITAITLAHRWRALLTICALTGLGVILMTRSRTATIGLCVSMLLFVHVAIRPKLKLALLWISICAILGAAISIGPSLADSASSAISRGGEDVSTLTGRMPMWEDVFAHYAMQRPLLGYGYTTFWTTDRITKISDDAGWGVSAAHSAYLELLLDLGVPGVIFYLAALIVSLLVVRRRLAQSRPSHLVFCWSLLWGLAIIGVTESELPFRTSAIYFYSLLGLLLPYFQIQDAPQETSRTKYTFSLADTPRPFQQLWQPSPHQVTASRRHDR